MSTSMREHFVDAYTILHVTDQGEVIKASLKEAVVYPQDLVRELSLQKEAEAEDDGNLKELSAVKEVEEREETIIAETDRRDFSSLHVLSTSHRLFQSQSAYSAKIHCPPPPPR
ncbi:hypothetical protein CRV24_005278 [Beauveria bassiana]|nr:hypothetical protein CRV24_005278 [Beauveria bassiana]